MKKIVLFLALLVVCNQFSYSLEVSLHEKSAFKEFDDTTSLPCASDFSVVLNDLGNHKTEVTVIDSKIPNDAEIVYEVFRDDQLVYTGSSVNYEATAGTYKICQTVTLADGRTCGKCFTFCIVGWEPDNKCDFITTWKTQDGSITLPITGNFEVDWENDGIFDITGTNPVSHKFSPGIHTIAVRGQIDAINFGTWSQSQDRDEIISVDQWGCSQWITFYRAFVGCKNLDVKAKDTPDLSNVTTLKAMFQSCESLEGTQANWNWNTSSIENTTRMFFVATNFNQNLNSWDVSRVTNMFGMFEGAANFDNGGSSLNAWKVSKVEDMGRMFMYTPFNQDISSWDVSSVKSFSLMFRNNPKFNQDINYKPNSGAWNVFAATYFNGMFEGATSFNKPLDLWTINMKQPVTMPWMFYGATNFDQNLNSWNISTVTTMRGMFGSSNFNNLNGSIRNWAQKVINVTDMHRMFAHSPFNQNINDWRVDNVTDMSMMFHANIKFNQPLDDWSTRLTKVKSMGNMFTYSNFNQNIGNWDVSSVTNMVNMFSNSSFNQNIGSWDVSNVENMSNMFYQNRYFNQNLGNWNLSSIQSGVSGTGQSNSLRGMFSIPSYPAGTGNGMGLKNYDDTLIGWANNSNTPNNIAFNALNISYCNADIVQSGMTQTALQILSSKGWNMTGHVQDCNAPKVLSSPSKNTTKNETSEQLIFIENKGTSFKVDVAGTKIKDVKVYNLVGQLIYKSKDIKRTHSIRVKSTGVYVLKIETDKGFKTKKILLKH